MIDKYTIRVTRAWHGVHNGQVLDVDQRRRDKLIGLGFAELVKEEKPVIRKKARVKDGG